MLQIRCEGDPGPHGQQGKIIGPEPLGFDEQLTDLEPGEENAADPQPEVVN